VTVEILTADKLSNEAYHAREAVGSSLLKTFIVNRPLAHAQMTGAITKSETAALAVGRLFHDRFDPGVDLDATYLVGPTDDKRTKAWKEAATNAGNRTMVKPSEWALAERMEAAVRANPYAAALLADAEHETSFRMASPYGGCDIQCRADILHRWSVLADLKTCEDVDHFHRAVVDRGYHIQAALYRRIVAAACGSRLPFVFIAVEKQAPHRCRVIELSERYLELGHRIVSDALHDLGRCFATGDWSDPTPCEVLDPPAWLVQRHAPIVEVHHAA